MVYTRNAEDRSGTHIYYLGVRILDISKMLQSNLLLDLIGEYDSCKDEETLRADAHRFIERFNQKYIQYELIGLDIHGTVCSLAPDNWEWILSVRLELNKLESMCIPVNMHEEMREFWSLLGQDTPIPDIELNSLFVNTY